MNRMTERVARQWSTPDIPRKNETNTSEESSSITDSTEYSSPRAKNASTPLRSRWSDLEEINRSRRGQRKIKDTQKVSSDERGLERLRTHKDRVNRGKHQDDRKRIIERKKGGDKRREKRGPIRRSEETQNKEQKGTSGSESSEERYGESDLEHAKRKNRSTRGNDELPITEILKRSQDNARTKYEQQEPFPALTTDKIYVQHRGGFSAMKINQTKDSRVDKNSATEEIIDLHESQNSPPIRVAIMIQQFWKRTGFLYQGLLGGMALMHFVMLHTFFNTSMEFIVKYSVLSEIYSTIFSFLVAMCIVSTFDKFDLARFDIEHLRELYLDYNKAMIAVPLYLVVFCLHQVCAMTDNQLNVLHYYSPNGTFWGNASNVDALLDDLNSWQKVSLSKDLLAVFAWLFISLGNKDDSFLMYLQSMEKYAHDVESSTQ